MKKIKVSAAIIIRKGNKGENEILSVQRGYGEYKGRWEFPGGKIEEGEDAETTVKRELKEELNAEISIIKKIGFIEYDYPTLSVSIDFFLCKFTNEKFDLLEHEAAKWLTYQSLLSVDWLEADRLILDKVKEELKRRYEK